MSNSTIMKPVSKPTSQNFIINYAWVLASIQEMVEESIYFCETFAHTLQAHHNPQASAVFERGLRTFQQEQQMVLEAIQAYQASSNAALPKISPWEKPYADYQHPAVNLMQAGYLMTDSEAEQRVSKMIQVHRDFYAHLLQTQTSTEIVKWVSALQNYCSHCALRD